MVGKKIRHRLLGRLQALSGQVPAELFKAQIRVLDGLYEDREDLAVRGAPSMGDHDHPPIPLSMAEDRFGGEIDETTVMLFARQRRMVPEQPEK